MKKLYHATSDLWLAAIFHDGLQPRDVTGHGNWEDYPSRPGLVYLTDSHLAQFSLHASRGGGRPTVVEVEVDEGRLVPDEDYLGQVENRRSGAALRVATVSVDPRDHRDLWRDSLAGIGTVAHDGPVSPEQVRRAVVMDLGLVARLNLELGSEVCLEWFALGGAALKDLAKLLMGDKQRSDHFTTPKPTGPPARYRIPPGLRTLVTLDPRNGKLRRREF